MLFTEEPITWPNPPQPSLLHVVLLFVGVPMLITAAIVLLVMAPSLAKGPRYSPGKPWDAEAEWFGAPERGATIEAQYDRPALEASRRHSPTGDTELSTGSTIAATGHSPAASTEAPTTDQDTGGASVRW